MHKSPHTQVDWHERILNQAAIRNVIALRRELPIFLIRWDPDKPLAKGEKPLEWIDLSEPDNRVVRPQHFESYFGQDTMRDAHHIEALKRAAQTQDTVLKELYGAWDIFHPQPQEPGRPFTFLYAGQFLLENPSVTSIGNAWRQLTGQEPASANQDFVQFVRMHLSLPVFCPDLLRAVKRFIKLWGDYIHYGDDDGSIRDEIHALNSDEFARFWPIRDWIDSVLSPNKFLPPPWHYLGHLTDWMKVGMGINTLPTTVMAIMPVDIRDEPIDPVDALVRNAQIQRACITFAREMPESAATTLQDYGIAIITSTRKGKNSARARLELRERAQKFRNFIYEKFGVRTVVGIGHSLAPGAPLNESYREAVMALHMCVQLEKDVLFYDEHGIEEKFRYGQLHKATERLLEAIDRENSSALKLACDQYVQLVLRYANQRIEVVRSQFLATLFQVFNTLQRRTPMRHDARESFINELADRLEDARSIDQVIDGFNDSLQRLSFVTTRAWRGPSVMLLEATLQYLRENFFEPLPLPEVARKAGFSVPVFTRVFKQATGMSYLTYLRTIRIEHAKKLLATTTLTLEQIGQSCGFHSQHHLIRSFKRVTGLTPGNYRKRHSNFPVE
ncbi:MAG: helix-turn-helix transcriptional regulator [Myxococcales bacterium]|nr:helix-turn-helix transcriptional regulator [Myxococcales bacterium]